MIINLKDIPLRKLFWIVLHCLINDSCLYTVQFGDITVEDDLLVAIYLKEMRFAAVQIPAKIGWCSLNGEKLDELHYVALIFGQFAVLHARSARFLHASICKAAVA